MSEQKSKGPWQAAGCILVAAITWSNYALSGGTSPDHEHEEATAAGDSRHTSSANVEQGLDQVNPEDEDQVILISHEVAEASGLGVRIAGPGSIERHISVYGRLATPPDQLVQSRARFPGIIRSIKVNVGDAVEQGQVLALIESNESLRTYELLSPITGVVQDRMANAGEVTGDSPLFTLVNTDTLWALLRVFPSQRFEVEAGQSVHVIHNGHVHDSEIASVTPGGQDQPFVVARVALKNTLGDMAPGDMVSAQIDAERVSVALAVDNLALQTLETQAVVFVQEGDHYHPRAVDLGRSDGRFTEINGGLAAGERYVAENSYLLKAELLKGGAAHEH